MILKGYEKEAPPKRGEASGDAAFSGAENAHARHAHGWQIVRFRAACAGRSRMERMEISAKMDAEMASRIIIMAVFSEQAKRAQETCAKRAVCIRFMVLRMVRSPFCGVFSEIVQAYHRAGAFFKRKLRAGKNIVPYDKILRRAGKKIVRFTRRISCIFSEFFCFFHFAFASLGSGARLPQNWSVARRCPVSRHERRFVHTRAQAGPLY